jgi:hypothetical protein
VIDAELITQSICATECSPIALEEGAGLVQAWIDAGVLADKKVIGSECGFVLWLDDLTAIIGVMDLLTDEGGEIVGNEFKTSKEASKYWNESKWIDSISAGSQIAIYALGLQQGTYYEHGTGRTITPSVTAPRVRVRAISKSNPPAIWGAEPDAVITFTQKELDVTRDALLVKAASIRAMRKSGRIPWQLRGHWCENKFRRQCEFYSECSAGKFPEGWAHFSNDDPAFEFAFPHLGDKGNDAELVVLGASAYGTVSECVEKYRRTTLGGNIEESLALSIGTVFHSGVSEFYKQIRESQNGNATYPRTESSAKET